MSHSCAGASSARRVEPARLGVVPQRRMPERVEATVYFLVAEALTNVTRYAQAERVEIDVADDHQHVTVEVRDDGRGGADPALGSGLRGLVDRVAALDGSFEVTSRAGVGTTLRAVIPCA